MHAHHRHRPPLRRDARSAPAGPGPRGAAREGRAAAARWSGDLQRESRRGGGGGAPPARQVARQALRTGAAALSGARGRVNQRPRVRDLLARKGALELESLTGEQGLDREIPSSEASSPGLVLAGYTARFVGDRIHILGETEISYLGWLAPAERR